MTLKNIMLKLGLMGQVLKQGFHSYFVSVCDISTHFRFIPTFDKVCRKTSEALGGFICSKSTMETPD